MKFIRQSTKGIILVLIFLLVLECLARIDDRVKYGANLWTGYNADMLRSFDSAGTRVNVPNVRFKKWRNNAAGFRGEEILSNKPHGVRRVVCLGSSETYGLYEKEGNEWPAQLRRLLNDETRYEIVNAGVAGLDLSQYRQYYLSHLATIAPDVIIVFANPFRYLSGLKNNPFRNGREERYQAETNRHHKFIEPRITSNAADAIRNMIPPMLLQKYQAYKYLNTLHRKQSGLAHKPYTQTPDSRVMKYRNDLEEMIMLLKKENVQIILTTYPVFETPADTRNASNILLEERIGCPDLSIEGIIDGLAKCNNAIKHLTSEYGLKCVDNEARIPNSTQCFADNVHYTDHGAKQIATNFADILKTMQFRDDHKHMIRK